MVYASVPTLLMAGLLRLVPALRVSRATLKNWLALSSAASVVASPTKGDDLPAL
jgi:hypothetical protein